MPRRARRVADDGVYHVLNRGNCRMDIFHKSGDFAAFVKLLEEARQLTDMRILAYCLMHNHWHLVLWPRRGKDLSRFMGWVGTTHVRRWREHRDSRGEGHLYQGRFKDFPIQTDHHLLTVIRYVEANPLRANRVQRAEDWPWSSLGGAPGFGGIALELSPWPVEKPRNWKQRVNRSLPEAELERLDASVTRGRPFGDEKWTAATVGKLGLENTVRDPWRPRKIKPAEAKAGTAGKSVTAPRRSRSRKGAR